MFHCMSGNDCGQFVGYVDDRGYSYSHRDPIKAGFSHVGALGTERGRGP